MPINFQGQKIKLEPLDCKKHLEGYYELSLDENVHTYVGNQVPKSINEIKTLLEVYESVFMNWIILEKTSEKVIGIMRLSEPSEEDGLIVAGDSQRLHSDYWRKGFMKEARYLLYNHYFNDLNVDILWADVWEGNENSLKSLMYAGYTIEAEGHDVFIKTGQMKRKYYLNLSREGWFNSNLYQQLSSFEK